MTQAKHTPGPWFVTGAGRSRYVEGRIRPGVLQEVAWCGATEEVGQMESNARLIAAAPCLLEALKACCEHMEWSTPQGQSAYVDARDAIAKATGSAA